MSALIEGDTGFMPLADLFLWLEQNRKSGVLRIDTNIDESCVFCFLRGGLAACESESVPSRSRALPGVTRLFERAVAMVAPAMEAAPASFRFFGTPDDASDGDFDNVSPGEVIMESLKRRDEAKRRGGN